MKSLSKIFLVLVMFVSAIVLSLVFLPSENTKELLNAESDYTQEEFKQMMEDGLILEKGGQIYLSPGANYTLKKRNCKRWCGIKRQFYLCKYWCNFYNGRWGTRF